MITLDQFVDQLDIACRHSEEAVALTIEGFVRARSKVPKPRPIMESFNFGRRTSLTELRPRHLLMVEEYGIAATYDRAELRDFFLTNWNRLFGTLRKSKALEVPSDQFRKEMMISRLLDLIEMRREEYSAYSATNGKKARKPELQTSTSARQRP